MTVLAVSIACKSFKEWNLIEIGYNLNGSSKNVFSLGGGRCRSSPRKPVVLIGAKADVYRCVGL